MKLRTLLILAAVLIILGVFVLAGGLPRGELGVGPAAPDWVEGIGGMLGPRPLGTEDLGSGTSCASGLAEALAGGGTVRLTAAACRIDVPVVDGLLVRPRALRLQVESGSLLMNVIQRGRGNSLELSQTFGSGDSAEATFGKRGGTVLLSCFAGCFVSFPP